MQLTRSELAQLERGRSLPNLQAAIGPYIDYYVSNKSGAYAGGVLYDVLVPLYYQYPELFTVATGCVDVVCESGAAYGKTMFTPAPSSTVKVCTDVQAKVAKAYFMDALSVTA